MGQATRGAFLETELKHSCAEMFLAPRRNNATHCASRRTVGFSEGKGLSQETALSRNAAWRLGAWDIRASFCHM